MNKPILSIFVWLMLLSVNAFAVWLPANQNQPTPFNESSDISVEMMGDYECLISITFPGIETTQESGSVKLSTPGLSGIGGRPVISGFINLPSFGNPTVEIVDLEYSVLDIDVSEFEGWNSFPAAISENDFISGSVSLGRPGILRDLRIASIDLMPYRIEQSESKIYITKEVSLKITFTPGESLNPKIFQNKKFSTAYKPLYEKLIWNFTDDTDDEYEPANYLIICPDVLADALEDLYLWKNKKGVRTTLVKYSEINANTEDDYILRDYIEYAYHNWEYPPDYVLLAGDDYNTPIHIEYTPDPPTLFSFASYPGNYIHDNYFACVEGDDYFPDVILGRLCVQTPLNAQLQVNKILKYEMSPNLVQTGWYSEAVVCADNEEASQRETKLEVRELMLATGGFSQVDTLFSGNQPSLFVSWANAGRSFINYRGTGWDYGWVGINVLSNTISNLQNYNKPSVVTGIGCGVAKFDGFSACFAETWMNLGTISNSAGAVAFIGPTWNTHTQYNDCLDREIYQALFEDSLRNLGAALVAGKMGVQSEYEPYIAAYPSVQEVVYTLFGQYLLLSDPELQTRAAPPKEIFVTRPDSVPLGESLISVTVEDEFGNPLEGLLVGAFIEGEVFAADLTDINGLVSLTVNPQSRPNDLFITVTGLDIATYADSIPVYAEAQFISVGEYELEDSSGDGVLSPGESAELSVKAVNYGILAANSVWAKLTVEQAGISITSDSIFFGDITVGEEVWSEDNFAFTVSSNYEPPYVDLTITFHDDQNYNWDSEIRLDVLHPMVIFSDFEVDPGPDDLLERGGEAEMTISVHNIGGLDVINMIGVLESLDPEVEIIDPVTDFGTIGGGEIASNAADPFEFLVTQTCPIDFPAHFRFTLSGDQGTYVFILEEEFELIVGDPCAYDPGSDAQGLYYAFESRDTEYVQAPVFNWVEISPETGGEGTPIDFDAQNQTAVVDLPFTFVYYNQEFDEITVSADGFIAPGESNYTSPINWGFPFFDQIEGMIAPLWDDLYCIVYEPGDVSYLYDQEEGAFRIEYHHWTHGASNVFAENFQVIIYNPSIRQTESGNSEIEFSYGECTDLGLNFSSCGIENPAQEDGIQIWFNYQYPVTTHPPESYTAILITTETPEFMGINDDERAISFIPQTVILDNNYPNPFNPITTFKFGLPAAGTVELSVYNIAGQKLAELANGHFSAGYHQVQWDAGSLSSGIYFARLDAGGEAFTVKCLLIK